MTVKSSQCEELLADKKQLEHELEEKKRYVNYKSSLEHFCRVHMRHDRTLQCQRRAVVILSVSVYGVDDPYQQVEHVQLKQHTMRLRVYERCGR